MTYWSPPPLEARLPRGRATASRCSLPFLILDLMMPTLTGWEVIDWLAAHRERKPGTVIVVSATERELLRQLDPTVVNAVIFKPFDIHQLGAYVKASCELPHHDRRQS